MKMMKQEKRRGVALLTVLGIVAVVSTVCGMLSVMARQQARSSQIAREMLRARMIAESGLNRAYHEIRQDFRRAANYRLQAAFGGGEYTVQAVALPGASANRAQLRAVGVNGLGRSVVAIDLENRPRTVNTGGGGQGDFFALPFDLLLGGDLNLRGNFHAGVEDIHANGSGDLGGSASMGQGPITISASGTLEWKRMPSNVTLRPKQSARQIFTPQLEAAINRLIQHAIAHGAVYATGAQVPHSPPGGVAYITGSDAGWSQRGTGTFIFAGAFDSKHLNITAVNNFPALIVLSPSDVHFNAGAVIRGAVLLPRGSLRFNGHAVIHGPLLVGQGIRGNGTADLYAGSAQGFNLPSQTVTQQDNVVITAWH